MLSWGGRGFGLYYYFFLQSEESGECWDNNVSQEKFFLSKLTASVLSLATAEQGDEPALLGMGLLQKRCLIPEGST